MLKVFGIIITVAVLYFLINHALEYRYWKETQKNAFSFTKNVTADIKNRNKEELEAELTGLKSSFEDNKWVANHNTNFSSIHEKVEKLARMYVLNETLNPQNSNYSEIRERYLTVQEGMAPECHYDLLIDLLQKENGLPLTIRNDLAFNNVCYGWNKLDSEFGFWDSPHAYNALRY